MQGYPVTSRSPSFLTLEGPGRCRLALTAPFAALAGALLGVQAATELGLPPAVLVVTSSSALLAVVALQIALEPHIATRWGGSEGRWSPVVSYGWDALTGVLMGLPVVTFLGDASLATVGAALSFGAAYGYVMGFLLCGEGPLTLVRMVFEGGSGKRRSGHSYAQALAAQGRVREALEVYRRAMAADPRDPEPYFGISNLQHQYLHDPEGAVLTLRSALSRAQLTDGHAILALQRMAAIRGSQDRPQALAPDLARYLDRAPTGAAAAWARGALDRIKSDMRKPDASDPG